jgi:membrane-bound lytic murein transglycosylase F
VLAAYNGGAHHIRDAMALARRDGRNQHSWDVVSGYVQLLSNPQYYQDPVVQHGYMRGYETVGYVRLIRQRYQQYKGVKAKTVTSTPQKSRNEKHRNKFHL